MECLIKKADLEVANKAVKKIVGRPEKVFLQTSKSKSTFSVVANDSVYLKYTIPATKVIDGNVVLYTSLFDKLVSLRKENLLLKKEGNVLRIKSGTQLKLYTIDEDPKIMEQEQEQKQEIVISPKEAGLFRNILDGARFTKIDGEGYISIRIRNDNFMELGLADSVHCAFYTSTETLSKSKFDIVTNFELLRSATSFIESKVKFKTGKSSLGIYAPNIQSILPVLQQDNTIDTAHSFLSNSHYKKGVIIFHVDELKEILNSLSIISEGPELLHFSIKNRICTVGLKTNLGTSKDHFKCVKSMDTTLNLPIIMFREALDSCAGKKIEMRISKEEKFYKLSSSDKQVNVECIGPIAN